MGQTRSKRYSMTYTGSAAVNAHAHAVGMHAHRHIMLTILSAVCCNTVVLAMHGSSACRFSELCDAAVHCARIAARHNHVQAC
jgi:hypothetical protein